MFGFTNSTLFSSNTSINIFMQLWLCVHKDLIVHIHTHLQNLHSGTLLFGRKLFAHTHTDCVVRTRSRRPTAPCRLIIWHWNAASRCRRTCNVLDDAGAEAWLSLPTVLTRLNVWCFHFSHANACGLALFLYTEKLHLLFISVHAKWFHNSRVLLQSARTCTCFFIIVFN